MPSEQAAGRPLYWSDLYSLGITAIYLLTGKQPQELEADSHTGEIIWHRHALNISPTLAGVIDRAIAYHPRDRFATAREMLDALQFGAGNFPATMPYIQPPPASVPSHPPLQNTVAVSPSSSPQSNNQSSGQKGILLSSLIIGGLIGTSIVIGLALNRPNQPVVQSSVSSASTPTPNEVQDIPTSSPSPISSTFKPQNNPPVRSPLPTPTDLPLYS